MLELTNLTVRGIQTFTLSILLLLIFSSCEKDIVLQEIDTEKEEIIDFLATLDYNIDSLRFEKDYVFYETDMAWPREHLLKMAREEIVYSPIEGPEPFTASTALERQRSITDANMLDAVTATNVTNIRFYIAPSVLTSCGLNWVLAIFDAASEWNSMSFCRVNFIEVSNAASANVIIAADNDPLLPESMQNLMFQTTIALAKLPNSGNAGSYISISRFWDLFPKKKAAMMHEMGHTIRFLHTGTGSGQHVHGTGSTQAGSVMNPGGATASANFKSGDIRMARLFYPDDLDKPSNFVVSKAAPGTVRITYSNANPTNKPYYWIRITKYNYLTNQIVGERYVRSTPSTTTNVHSLTWGGHGGGKFKFAVRAFNFRRDVWSARTDRLLVIL